MKMCGAGSAIIVSMTAQLIVVGMVPNHQHCCSFPVARKGSIITTFNSAEMVLLRKVDGETISLTKSLSSQGLSGTV